MRIAREGWPFLGAAVLLAVFLGALRLWALLLAWLPVTGWVAAFFRDPARLGPRDERLVIAPADGKVVSVIPMEEPEFLGSASTRISIFMNIFDVHVNRYPAGGQVAHRAYVRGAFRNAAGEKASRDNEQASVGLSTPRGPILIRQIAGLVARRIVTDHGVGARVRQGDRLGMIRFGSRVDLFLPPNAAARIAVGERTRAGVTVVGEWT